MATRGRLTIKVEREAGLNVNKPHLELRGVGFDFVDDSRKNRMQFEDAVAVIEAYLYKQEIIDRPERRS